MRPCNTAMSWEKKLNPLLTLYYIGSTPSGMQKSLSKTASGQCKTGMSSERAQAHQRPV
jgi:hypothetical protein